MKDDRRLPPGTLRLAGRASPLEPWTLLWLVIAAIGLLAVAAAIFA